MESVEIILSMSILLLMLALSFIFSGTEIAFLSANRLKIELKLKQGSRAARILSAFNEHKEEIIIAILIGNNIALVLFTQKWELLTEPFLSDNLGISRDEQSFLYTLIQTVAATLLILVFAEYIPKAIFRQNSDRVVYPLAYVLNVIHKVLYIPILLINYISKVILRYIFQVKTDEKVVELGKKDLDAYILEVLEASESLPVEDLDTHMLSNALRLKDIKAKECMIPRTEIQAISVDSTVDELMEKFIETQLSKILVYGKDMDEIRGFVHSHGMFSKPQLINDILQPVFVVPETMPANILLGEFTESKRSVALVVDEFGGTAGMITIEDLVEEVFGEIEDEHDDLDEEVEEDMICIKQDDGTYLLGARLEIDDINDNNDIEFTLPDEEYFTTLGGLILYYLEDIPQLGQVVVIGNYQMTVEKASPNKIILVKVEQIEV